MKHSYLLFLFLLLFPVHSFAQQANAKHYNEYGIELSDFLYNKRLQEPQYLDLHFRRDQQEITILVPKEKVGQLAPSALKALQAYLQKIGKSSLADNGYLVINYLSPLASNQKKFAASKWNVLDANFSNRLAQRDAISLFWIYDPNSKRASDYQRKYIHWIPDKERLLNRLFFPYAVPHGSFLLIKPNGAFYYHQGPYDKDYIWKQMKRFFFPKL